MTILQRLLDMTMQPTPIRTIRLSERQEVILKLEGANQSGSIKDRAAYNMLLTAAANNELHADTIVAESTSGNTGVALAYYCRQLGIEYHNYSPNSLSPVKRNLLESYGAKIFGCDGGTDEATKMLREVIDDDPDTFFWPSQFENQANPQAHTIWTGPEILQQVPDVETVACAFGSGGTATGLARVAYWHNFGIFCVQNTDCRDDRVEGMRNLNWISKPAIADIWLIQAQGEMVSAIAEELLPVARQVRDLNDGLIVAPTTAAILTQVMGRDLGKTVVVSPDDGERYPEWVGEVNA